MGSTGSRVLRPGRCRSGRVYTGVTRGFLAAGFVLWCAAGAGAQELPPGPIADSAERLGREAWSGSEAASGQPIFRSGVTVDVIPWPQPWTETSRQRSLRPRGGTITHHTYLTMTTPPALRGSTMFFVGVTTDPGAVIQDIKKHRNARQAKRVREQIALELAELERRRLR